MAAPIINVDALIDSFPEDAAGIQRLVAVFAGDQKQSSANEFPLKQLVELSAPIAEINLAKILNALVSAGSLKRIIRVECFDLGVSADFSSLMDAPTFIYGRNHSTGRHVTLEDIRIVYQKLG